MFKSVEDEILVCEEFIHQQTQVRKSFPAPYKVRKCFSTSILQECEGVFPKSFPEVLANLREVRDRVLGGFRVDTFGGRTLGRLESSLQKEF